RTRARTVSQDQTTTIRFFIPKNPPSRFLVAARLKRFHRLRSQYSAEKEGKNCNLFGKWHFIGENKGPPVPGFRQGLPWRAFGRARPGSIPFSRSEKFPPDASGSNRSLSRRFSGADSSSHRQIRAGARRGSRRPSGRSAPDRCTRLSASASTARRRTDRWPRSDPAAI